MRKGPKRYVIRALQTRGTRRAYYAGDRFDFNAKHAVTLPEEKAAKLLKKLEPPRGWRLGLMPVDLLPGGRNPSDPTRRAMRQAGRLFEDFTGHTPDRVDKVKLAEQHVFLIPGVVDEICYTTVRDGEVESYRHEFKDRSKPLMAVGANKREIRLIKGRFRFTERGIQDY